jgi:Ca2+-binding EF-hand superfamily protein
MKKFFAFLIISIFVSRLSAQTNEPVRLALISETDEASAASDILTAQLSGNPKIQLLERNEIEKVYREQGLSTGNRDYLKLGQILGADGLLLFDVDRTPQATNLTARLIAVKPGVVLLDEDFSWPLKDIAGWAPLFANHLNLFVPKLTVLIKDTIPISVVNLRSAIQSDEAKETEQQLKLLAIQRLSREPQFFVLERQKMQLLSEEKELKLDDSAFWNGSYLLEGVADQNGYSKEIITINARLTPPKGGAPILIEVSGSRTNLSEVINQLALKVDDALKINSTVKEWNTADEATQYFDEAKWAVRWGVHSEAQAAADSAWGLGKHDEDCATIRIKAYMNDVPDVVAPNVTILNNSPGFHYVHINELPDPKYCDIALNALELYREFSQILPPDEPKADSDWYQLGINDLAATSRVLRHFNYVPESQKPVAEKLAELRALARSVAALISKSPSVHDSYFVSDRIVGYDELHHFEETPNIFNLKLDYGCLWQETPEDEIALYRELMSSPVFCYIHRQFWFRDSYTPRLVAWNETDQERIPILWSSFMQELTTSSNPFWRLEAKAVCLAEATNSMKMSEAFTNFFNAIFENPDLLVTNHVEQLAAYWQIGDLVNQMGGDTFVEVKDSLERVYYSEYYPKLETLSREYQDKVVLPAQTDPEVEKQVQYLKNQTLFDFGQFTKTFSFFTYSRAQAEELQPLLIAYKSNLIAQANGTVQREDHTALVFVGGKLDWVNALLKQPAQSPQIHPSRPVMAAKAATTVSAITNAPEGVTNVVTVSKFLAIPLGGLSGDELESNSVIITAHHWREGKLLLDFQYIAHIYSFDEKGAWKGTREATIPAIAILDCETEHWNVIRCPEESFETKNNFYHRSTFLHGELFNCDGGQIKKYDFQDQQWQVLPISDGGNYELFVVNDRLYAANGNIIFEIMDEGKSTRILASTRRQPPVSALDTQELGTPALFEGPGHSLRVCTKNNIFTWTGNDWREDSAAPPASFPPVISTDGVLFRTDGFNLPANISSLASETNAVEFLLGQKKRPVNSPVFYRPGASTPQEPQPLWKLPMKLSLANLPATRHQADLYLLVDHSEIQEIANDQHEVVLEKVIAKDGYNAALLCFSHDLPLPQKLFLKFDAPDGCPPVTGINPSSNQMFPVPPPVWMFYTTNFLFCGLEKPNQYMPNGAERIGIGYKAGIWMIPVAQLDAAIAGQKQIQLAQMAQTTATAEQARKNLLVKYDANHNGLIDSEEREEALVDPAFIESELDVIDANHNGWLDAEELGYFDANKNKILEPKEQAGIEIAQHLLAEKLLKKFDADGDGLLDHQEFGDLFQSSIATSTRSMNDLFSPYAPFPDENHDGKIDLGELESFLKQQTRRSLRSRGMPGAPLFNQMRIDASQPVDPRQMFKAAVEFYWQNPGGVTNRPPFNRMWPTNEIRGGITQ